MVWGSCLPASLLELILPEICSLCEAVKGTVPWAEKGVSLPGLRPWDGPHLCAECLASLENESGVIQTLSVPGRVSVPVLSSQRTNPHLVKLVGDWKYRGLRGLVWPLAHLLKPILASGHFSPTADTLWVPLPLHRRRQRERGFNQASLLAEQLALAWGGQMREDLVARRRSTGQQAKLLSDLERAANLHNAFRARAGLNQLKAHSDQCSRDFQARHVILVDDLVTSGATVGALVELLNSKGISVKAVVCLGVAAMEE